jgi:hypothetical protein
MSSVRPSPIRAVLTAIGFVVAVVLIALGAAGLVTAMDAPPSGAGRPELTNRGDHQVTLALDQLERDLAAVGEDVDALGTQARGALAALAGSELPTVEAAIAKGDTLVADIGRQSQRLQAEYAALPLVDTPAAGYQLSPAVRARADRLRAALTATDGLDDAWSRLTTGSITATKLSGLLGAQVDAVVGAIDLGRQAEYAAAVKALDPADAAIAGARKLRDTLAKTVEVSTLDQWLDRSEAYDVALRKLYVALRDSKGRVTKAVRTAIEGEKAAKDRLPPDARGLVVIMSDIGRGGMNDAVIAIEQARGRLADALRPPEDGAPDASPTVAP